MMFISIEEYKKLSEKKKGEYIKEYLQFLLQDSINKQQDSRNYDKPSWAFHQAEHIGVQKTINNLLRYYT